MRKFSFSFSSFAFSASCNCFFNLAFSCSIFSFSLSCNCFFNSSCCVCSCCCFNSCVAFFLVSFRVLRSSSNFSLSSFTLLHLLLSNPQSIHIPIFCLKINSCCCSLLRCGYSSSFNLISTNTFLFIFGFSLISNSSTHSFSNSLLQTPSIFFCSSSVNSSSSIIFFSRFLQVI